MPILHRTLVLRTSPLLAAVAAAALVACEGSGDSGSAGSFDALDGGFEASPDQSPDGGTAADAADAADPARAAELAKMQAHLDSLYAQSDVVHRFTTTLGDKVDCLPFQRQPGFSRVNSLNGAMPVDLPFPPAIGASGSEAGLGTGVDADGNTRGCPSGSVPIRHIELSDLARFDTLQNFLAKYPTKPDDPGSIDLGHHEYATYDALDEPNWGAQTTLNVWKPAVENDNFSLSQMWIADGSIPTQQTVEAGYIANPQRTDFESRLFIYSTTDGYNNKDAIDCWNLECKSFVQLADSHILLGGQFDKMSILHGEQRIFRLRYQYCPASQCKDWEGWWLHYEGGSLDEWIGFYPAKRFGTGSLHDGSAMSMSFGGEMSYAGAERHPHPTTDMGSGEMPEEGFGAAAYQTDLAFITPDNTWADIEYELTTFYAKSNCYRSGPLTPAAAGFASANRLASSMFYFGGTGQSAACP